MAGRDEYVIIGLNGTGRTLAAMLALSQNNKILLVDDDTVSETVFEQGYTKIDVGLLKGEAVRDAIKEINSKAIDNIKVMSEPIEASLEELEAKIGNLVVFCCKPYSNKTRAHIAKTLNNAAQHVYFCSYDDRGNYEILICADGGKDFSAVYDLPNSKENPNQYQAAATELFVTHMNKQ